MPEVNKVVYYGDTLIDLTNDTAEASDVVAGKYFHLANGERASGTANYAPLNHDHDDRYYTETETNNLLDALDEDIFDFKRFRTLTNDDDLNDLDQEDSSGVYYIDSLISEKAINSPVGKGILFNIRLSSTYVYQFIIGEAKYCYFRRKVASGWGTWHNIASFSDQDTAVKIVTENNETGFVISSDLVS